MNYDLCNEKVIDSILRKHGFSFSKALGQNFICNPEVCPRMAEELGADENTGVIEIGPGIGVLTKELCAVAGKVVAIELDTRLIPVLSQTLEDYSNVEVINADVMKLDLRGLIEEKFSELKSVKVCANLPYYITSPIIMMLLESELPIDEIEVMVQKEAAQRLCAEIGSRDSGAVTIAVGYRAQAQMLFEVLRDCFVPSPNVDSAVMKLKIRKQKAIEVSNEKQFFSVIKAAFSQRRKTAVNSISNSLGINKQELNGIFERNGINTNARAETLSLANFKNITEEIYGKEQK